MTFWLGGMPSWLADTTGSSLDVTLPNGTTKVLSTQPVSGFLGFSANPADPFDNSASRIQPFYDFNLTCLLYSVPTVNNPGGIEVWPSNACDKTVSPPCPIVYFRAENTNYTVDGETPNLGGGRQRLPSYQNLKCWPPLSSTTSATPSAACVCPAADSRLSQFGTQSYIWVNPASFQIFSAGLDATYGEPIQRTDDYWKTPDAGISHRRKLAPILTTTSPTSATARWKTRFHKTRLHGRGVSARRYTQVGGQSRAGFAIRFLFSSPGVYAWGPRINVFCSFSD